MPIPSHIRWVRKHFLTDPLVQQLEPSVRIESGILRVNSAQFETGLSLAFSSYELNVYLHENGELVDILESLDVYPLRVGKHQFECAECSRMGNYKRFSSARLVYLDHCIEPLLTELRKGKYLRRV